MKIKLSNNHTTLDQEQYYIKSIISRFEKTFIHQFKDRNTPLPNNFVTTKKDSSTTET